MNESNVHDLINHPPHYKVEGLPECIELIEGLGLNYRLGCAMKYLYRAGRKGPTVQDLKKAVWYIEREIDKISCTPVDMRGDK